jgi:hypothetical protein
MLAAWIGSRLQPSLERSGGTGLRLLRARAGDSDEDPRQHSERHGMATHDQARQAESAFPLDTNAKRQPSQWVIVSSSRALVIEVQLDTPTGAPTCKNSAISRWQRSCLAP